MNTIQANLDKTLQEFKTDAERRETAAEKRDKEAAQRETANMRWIIGGLVLACTAIVVGVVALL